MIAKILRALRDALTQPSSEAAIYTSLAEMQTDCERMLAESRAIVAHARYMESREIARSYR